MKSLTQHINESKKQLTGYVSKEAGGQYAGMQVNIKVDLDKDHYLVRNANGPSVKYKKSDIKIID